MRSMLGPLLWAALATAGCGDDDDAPRDGGDHGRDASAGASGRDADDGGSGSRADAATDAGADADADAGPTADCDAGDIPAFGDVAIFAKCLGCHSTEVEGAARRGAPPTMNFDDYDSAAAMAELAAFYVFHGIMPPPVAGITVTTEEKEQLYLWALCGAPE